MLCGSFLRARCFHADVIMATAPACFSTNHDQVSVDGRAKSRLRTARQLNFSEKIYA